MPSWLTDDTFAHSAFVSRALVATTPIVVLSGSAVAPPGFAGAAVTAASRSRSAREGRRRRWSRDSHGRPVVGSINEPAALTTASAATTIPLGSRVLADPTPPWRPPAIAPAPAPTAPLASGARRAAWAARKPNVSSGRLANAPPRPRSKITAPGTMGTTHSGRGPVFCPTGNPIRFDSSQRIIPPAAASPYALPPVRHTPWTSEMRFSGRNRSVSRVPGPPPRTSTPAVAPAVTSTAVVPVRQPLRIRW